MTRAQRRDVQRFADLLEIVLVRIRCGRTLRQAVQGLPDAVPQSQREAWHCVRHSVDEGRLGAEAGVSGLLQRIRLEERAQGFLDRATGPVSGQAKLIAGLTLLFLGAAYALFPAGLRPGFLTLGASGGFAAVGFVAQHFLLKRARRGLWMADWVRVLALWKSRLAWGSTPAHALNVLEQEGHLRALPECLQGRLQNLLAALRRGVDAAETCVDVPHSPAETYACEQLEALGRLALEGMPLTELLSTLAESTEARFRLQAEETAEQLKAQALAPLLLFHFPSFAILWMGPLLGSLLGLGSLDS